MGVVRSQVATAVSRGILEVQYRNEWYDVCLRDAAYNIVWSLQDAAVVCKQLGFLSVVSTGYANNYLEEGNENFDSNDKSFDNFKCSGGKCVSFYGIIEIQPISLSVVISKSFSLCRPA